MIACIFQDLSPLEERLVSPRLPFMQFKVVGREGQPQLKGNVVNVENDLDICAEVLPRQFDEMSTVQVKLMRRMMYRAPYMYETIRPAKVYKAAKYLVTTELYQEEGVELSEDWSGYTEGKLNYFFLSLNFKIHFLLDDVINFEVPDNNPSSSQTQNDSEDSDSGN